MVQVKDNKLRRMSEWGFYSLVGPFWLQLWQPPQLTVAAISLHLMPVEEHLVNNDVSQSNPEFQFSVRLKDLGSQRKV
ncbi:unnamed protein product [Protopolystoma xenopodis]|uniref:Uncharacterized protein n=1 Tax=Protopolystoma xenopodis TaxID=117903 RepID=A0A3S5AXT5_9PLAT|nr:unnamed protein product [Protopolystoma xenopodis]